MYIRSVVIVIIILIVRHLEFFLLIASKLKDFPRCFWIENDLTWCLASLYNGVMKGNNYLVAVIFCSVPLWFTSLTGLRDTAVFFMKLVTVELSEEGIVSLSL